MGATAPNVNLDVERSLDFLWSLPTKHIHLTTLNADTGVINGQSFKRTSRDKARTFIENAQRFRGNVYANYNDVRPLHSKHKKASKDEVLDCYFLHCDAEVDKSITDPVQFDKARAELLARIQADPKPPTLIVNSGNGYALFWQMGEPTKDVATVEACNIVLRDKWSGDNCQDACHVMRVPFTINYSTKQKIARGRPAMTQASVVDDGVGFNTYHLDEFAAAHVEPQDAPADGGIDIPDTVDLSPLGADFINEIKNDKTEIGKRSDRVCAVAAAMRRAGFSDGEIVSVIINPDFGISAHILDAIKANGRTAEAQAARIIEWMNKEGVTRGSTASDDFVSDDIAGLDDKPKSAPKEKTHKPIVATPFNAARARATPPRDWLNGYHLCRGYISGTVAPGGGSKTSLVLVESVAMALQLDLLGTGMKYYRPLNIWYWNGEDSQSETDRRLLAIVRYFGRERFENMTVDQKLTVQAQGEKPLFDFGLDDLKGHLWTDSGRDTPIRLAKMKDREAMCVEIVYDELIYQCRQNKIDALVIDPFVSSHSLPNENDNAAVDLLMKEQGWGGIVQAADIGVEHVHHSRKVKGEREIGSADARGASAQNYGWRDGRVLNFMSDFHGDQFKIPQAERWRYFQVDSDTPRMSARQDAQWRKLVSMDLGNTDEHGRSDNVGVVTGWTPPVAVEFAEDDERNALVDRILAMIDSGEKITKRSGGDYTVKKLAKFLSVSKETVEAILDQLYNDKVIGYEKNTAGGHGAAGYYRKDAQA